MTISTGDAITALYRAAWQRKRSEADAAERAVRSENKWVVVKTAYDTDKVLGVYGPFADVVTASTFVNAHQSSWADFEVMKMQKEI